MVFYLPDLVFVKDPDMNLVITILLDINHFFVVPLGFYGVLTGLSNKRN